MNYKVLIKVGLYKLGLRQTLPAPWINSIEIKECGEPMVNIRHECTFLLGGDLIGQEQVLLRETVVSKLRVAESMLPKGLRFKIYSAYRSLSLQKKKWDERLEVNRQKHPNATETELAAITKGEIANPTTGFGGHQTGGAVDITLCDSEGNDLDMGTFMHEHNVCTPMYLVPPQISDSVYRNRQILKSAMQKAGFNNYPGEWWHFSYGDRMWAAYRGKKSCQYGCYDEGKLEKPLTIIDLI